MPPTTRSRAKPKVITEDGEPVDGDGELLDATGDADQAEFVDVDDADIPESLVFHSDTEAQEKRETDPGTVFEFDGRRFRAFKPKDTVLVTMVGAASANATVADQVDAVTRFLNHCLEPVAKMHLQNRLYDRDDRLEWQDLAEIMIALLDHWDARPREERRAKQAELARGRRDTDAQASMAGRERIRGRRR